MKRHSLPLLLMAAAFSFFSCNDIQETNVDFGGNTYVNEYGSLTEAIDRLTQQLKESNAALIQKLAAIEDAMSKGMADQAAAQDLIRVAIESLQRQVEAGQLSQGQALEQLTAAINAQSADLGTKLAAVTEAINVGFINNDKGLDLIADAIEALTLSVKNGFVSNAEALAQVRDAIDNANTDLTAKLAAINIALETGFADAKAGDALIAASIASLKDAVEAGNLSQEQAIGQLTVALHTDLADLGTKLAALTSAVNAGFANMDNAGELIKEVLAQIKVAIENQTVDLSTALNAVNTAVATGFTDAVTAQKAIEDAILKLKVSVDNGNTSNAEAMKQLLDAIGNLTTDLGTKLSAISSAVATGFADEVAADNLIKEAINALSATVDAGLLSMEQAMEQFELSLTNQMTDLGTKLAAIATANKEGFAGVIEVNNLIEAAIGALTAEVKAGNKSNEQALEELTAALNAQAIDLSTRLAAIEKATIDGLANITVKLQLVKEAIDNLKASVDAGNLSNEQAIGKLTAALTAYGVDLSTKLAAIAEAEKTGLANLATKAELIKVAIEALTLEVNAGNLSNEEALLKIKDAINTQGTDLSTKLAAIEQAEKSGFASLTDKTQLVKEAIDNLKAEVKAGNLTNEQALGEIKTAINTQGADLSTKLAAIEAAEKAGLATLADKTQLVKEAIDNLKASVDAGNLSNEQALGEIKDAIDDLDTDLSTKFDLINSTIEAGLATVKDGEDLIKEAIDNLKAEVKAGNLSEKAALDAIEDAINNQSTDLSTKLAAIQGAIETGFVDNETALGLIEDAIKSSGKDTADQIAALNTALQSELGDLCIKLQAIATANADGLGDLEDMLKTALDALIAEIKAGNKSNADALAEIKAAINAQGIELCTKLATINLTIKDGLASVKDGEDLIKDAIKALKEAVVAGSTSQADALAQIKNALTDPTTGLAVKLGAIEQAIATGFANETAKSELIRQAIVTFMEHNDASFDDLTKELEDLDADMVTWLTAIEAAIKGQTTSLETALGNIEVAIDDNTTAINNLIADLNTALKAISDAITAGNTDLAAIVTALANIKTAIDYYQDAADVIEAEIPCMDEDLHKMYKMLRRIADGKGVKYDGDETVYILPSIWDDIKNNPDAEDTELYNAIIESLEVFTPVIKCVQLESDGKEATKWTEANMKLHLHMSFTQTSIDSYSLVGEEVVFDGTNYVKVKKVAGDATYSIQLSYSTCASKQIKKLWVYDAKAIVYQKNDPTNTNNTYIVGPFTSAIIEAGQHGIPSGGWTGYDATTRPYRTDECASQLPQESAQEGQALTGVKLMPYYKDPVTGNTGLAEVIYVKAITYTGTLTD